MLLDIVEPGTNQTDDTERATAIGIDLGTTHSLVSYVQDNEVFTLPDAHGNVLLPSIISIAANGTLSVGKAVEGNLNIRSIKTLMGRGIEDVKRLSGTLPFEVETGEGMVRIRTPKGPLTPVELSAEILKTLKNRAEAHIEQEITQTVITVPAYFDEAARSATKDAARLAGLEVLRLINEPTSAALAYGLDNEAEGIYAVYDFGGGTFDVSLLKMQQGVFHVLATGGDAKLGGDDIDHVIAENMLKQNTTLTPENALLHARHVKEALSAENEITNNGITYTRADIEALIAPIILKTMTITQNVFADAGLNPKDIKGLVLVGGSTRIPLIHSLISQQFGITPLTDVNPDTVVAEGAAMQASQLTGGGHGGLLIDVVPLSLGLETMGGLFEKIILRNSTIPSAESQEFTTYQDGQTAMSIHVLQGEREMVAQNRSLARFNLTNIPPLKAGLAKIRVTFTVDADGLLTVSAEELTTGQKQDVAVKPSYGIDEARMMHMLRESMAHAEEDITTRLLQEAKVEADIAIRACEAALIEDGAFLDAAERKKIDDALESAKTAASEADRDTIDQAVMALDKAAEHFAEERVNNALRKNYAGHNVEKMAQSVEDTSHENAKTNKETKHA